LARIAGARLPDVVAVSMTDDLLTLVLTSPAPLVPDPWTVDQTGTRWSIRRSDPLPYDEGQRARCFAPFPTLASVGCTPAGEHWLLDLERVAAASLSGDAERCLDLARFLAAELAHNTWSEMLQVTLAGFGEELAAINPDRLTYTDNVDKAIAALTGRLKSVTEAMRVADTDVLSDRLHDIAADAWAPQVLLIAPHAARASAELTELLTELKRQPARIAVAVLLAGDTHHADDVRWQLTIDDAGILNVPALGLELHAHQLPAEEAEQLAQVLALAAVPEDRPVPPAHGSQPWDAHADACCGLRIDQIGGSHQQAPKPAGAQDGPSPGASRSSPSTKNSLLPLSPQTYLEQAATTEHDLQALAPATDDGVRHQVETADPALDADLADWADPSCPRPKLTLLGPVQVRAQGALPERNPRRQFHTEIVAYLATRSGGVTSERYATAIWPNEPRRHRQDQGAPVDLCGTGLARCEPEERLRLPSLGAHRRGGGALPHRRHPYRCRALPPAPGPRPGPRSRRHRRPVRGARPGHRSALRPADPSSGNRRRLRLADRRGRPAGPRVRRDDRRRRPHRGHALPRRRAARACGGRCPGGAEGWELRGCPLLDLVAACDAQDKRAEADAYVARILANHDAEVEEDLPPRTAEILFRRQWTDRPG